MAWEYSREEEGRRIGGREKMMVKEEGGRCEREKRKIT